MALLLDTHFTYWLTLQPGALRDAERALIATHARHVCVSAVSLWELKLKWSSRRPSGERKFAFDPADILGVLQDMRIPVLPLMAQHAVASLVTPTAHKDPFDLMLLQQAQQEGLQLLTRNIILLTHPLALAGC